ncbi:hypothetical protein AB0L17_37850 [Streptomyces cellulosae]
MPAPPPRPAPDARGRHTDGEASTEDLHATEEGAVTTQDLHATGEPLETKDLHATSEPFKPTK